MEQAEGTQAEGGTAVSVVEAAAILGISPRAVRMRIERGTLEAWRVNVGRTEEWRIQRAALQPASKEGTSSGTGAWKERKEQPSSSHPEWPQERAELREQVAWLRGKVDALTRLLEAERSDKSALEARLVRMLPGGEVQEQPRRRWWKFGRP